MRNRRMLGQEATEFVLISILVFFSALLVVFLFGNKIAKFFTEESSAAKVANAGSRSIDPSTGQSYSDPSTLTTATQGFVYNDQQTTASGSSADLGKLNIVENPDGSTSFDAGGRHITINSAIISKFDQVMQTSAGSAKTEIIKEIANLISLYQKENPGEPVPEVELDFGISDIQEGPANYNGVAEKFNQTTIKLDKRVVVIQKDNACTGSCNEGNKQRKLEGIITGTNTMQAYISQYDDQSKEYMNKLALNSATINISNGILQGISGDATFQGNYGDGLTEQSLVLNYHFDGNNNTKI